MNDGAATLAGETRLGDLIAGAAKVYIGRETINRCDAQICRQDMRFYTVHIKPDSEAPDRGARFVKQGFCWPAFLFRWVWAFATGLWLEGLAVLGLELVLALALTVIIVDPISSLAIAVGWYLILGTIGNDLRRWNLARRGYREVATVAERDVNRAERRYFEHLEPASGAIGGATP